MAWILILSAGAALLALLLLVLFRLQGQSPIRPVSRPKNRKKGNPVQKLTGQERQELLANVRAAAQADPHRTAQLIREWISESPESDEK